MMTKHEAEYNNQTAKYWLLEEPEVLETGKNTLRYYPKAKRLSVQLPDYYKPMTGERLPGRGTGLNLAALAAVPEVLDRVIEILTSLKNDTVDKP